MGKFNFKNYDRKNRNYGNKEPVQESYSKLTSKKLADALNEEYARSQLMGKSAWSNPDFQKLMLEVATRWAAANKRKRIRLEF